MNNHVFRKEIISGFLIAVFFFVPGAYIFGKVGVGMGAGEIRLNEGVKLGGIYELPSVRIFNTGDEVATYGMGIAYHQDHPELRPQKDWFLFKPETFTLNPGESQEVEIVMTVPLKETPGDYFAFIESGPVATNAPGTSVGIAVATKLYFTLVPANIFQALTFRVSSFLVTHAPWTWIALGGLAFVLSVLILRRFVSFNVTIRKS